MKIIGITGGTGSGKTTALNVLARHGALIIDCDAVYHRLLSENAQMLGEIEARFPGVVSAGTIDRQELGRRVFSDKDALLELNSITHAYVNREVDKLLLEHERSGGGVAAIDAIALIESGVRARCQMVIGVIAPTEKRVLRLTARDSISEEYARLRIDAQPSNEYYREKCDYVLDNSFDSIAEFEDVCESFFERVVYHNN